MKPINRGYTRALAYLFDGDDEAPMPKPHLPLSRHPPPTRQPVRSAESARIAEPARSAESARTAKHCTERLHPYEPATQRVRSTVPVHELAAPHNGDIATTASVLIIVSCTHAPAG